MVTLATFQQWVKKNPHRSPSHNSLENPRKTTAAGVVRQLMEWVGDSCSASASPANSLASSRRRRGSGIRGPEPVEPHLRIAIVAAVQQCKARNIGNLCLFGLFQNHHGTR